MEHTSVHKTYPDVFRESWSWWRPIQRKHLFAWPVRSHSGFVPLVCINGLIHVPEWLCRSVVSAPVSSPT